MNCEFKRKLPAPQVIKEMYPITPESEEIKKNTDRELYDIFTGTDNRFILVIGPCSAPRGFRARIYFTSAHSSG